MRFPRLLLVILAVLILALPLLTVGEAQAIGGGAGIEILCDGDCGALDAAATSPGGEPFDFDLGLRVLRGGLDLTIESGGDVYLQQVGPLRATGSVHLSAADIHVLGDLLIEADRVELWSRGSEIVKDGTVVVPPIVPPALVLRDVIDRIICACITVAGPETSVLAGDLELVGGGVSRRDGASTTLGAAGDLVVRAVAGVAPDEAATPGLWFTRAGDVFVDVSGVGLENLKVVAKGRLVIAGEGARPVPEPGPALLLGLGLWALSRPTRRSTTTDLRWRIAE